MSSSVYPCSSVVPSPVLYLLHFLYLLYLYYDTSGSSMHLIKLTIAYDGTDFHGWQIQSGKPTVQGAVTDVIRKITQEGNLAIHGAGRTDSGVHALGQVAHFRTRSELRPEEFQRALNAMLPPSIRIVAAEEVGPDFHSRWASLGKTYQYRIFRGRVVPPFESRYVLHYPYPLDEDAMCRAARLFEGEHDFTSFAASTGSEDEDRDRSMNRMRSGPDASFQAHHRLRRHRFPRLADTGK